MQTSTIEAADATQSPPAPPEFDIPDKSWGQEKLAIYVKERLAAGQRLEDEAIKLGRRSAEEVYYAGMALAIVKDQLKSKGKWMFWQELHGLAPATVNETIRLYEHIMDPEKLKGMTITEAKIGAGIIKSRKTRDKVTPETPGTGEDARTPEPQGTGEDAKAPEPQGTGEDAKAPDTADPARIVEDLRGEMERLAICATALTKPIDTDIADADLVVQLLDGVLAQMRDVMDQLRKVRKAYQAKVPAKPAKQTRRKPVAGIKG